MSIWNRIERRLSELADELMPDDLRLQLDSAREKLERGQVDEATELLEVLVDARPEHPGALSMLGAAYLEHNRDAEAMAMFDRALATRGDFPDASIGRGQAALALGQVDEAIASFRGAVDDAGGDRAVLAVAYRGLGMAHRCQGELDKAIRELRKSVAEAPKDAFALAALGEAMLSHAGTPDSEARKYLSWALEQPSPPALASIVMGELCLADGEVEAALAHFVTGERVAEAAGQNSELCRALVGKGDAEARAGHGAEANASYLRALEIAPKRADIHARIAGLHSSMGNYSAALGSYQYALELGADVSVLRRAVQAALDGDLLDAAVPLANQLLATTPADPVGLLVKARSLGQERSDEARELYQRAIDNHAGSDAHVDLGELDLQAGLTAVAAERALAALRITPHSERARDLLERSRRAELGAPSLAAGDSDMYELAIALHRITMARPSLSELSAPAASAASDFDRPLLLTVMGEFSSGKSTFVNAFIGSDVAPTGITPTTATINVVKYGRERGGRILYRDGRVETLGWDALFAALRGFDDAQARDIDIVEILLPLEALERVNIVDTPGLNSIQPEHQATARSFIERADAVVWLFSAAQAGKASERKALDEIRAAGKQVLGVLNKVDQLDDTQLSQIREHLAQELEGRLEALIPVSARAAVADADDPRWLELVATLEQRFFIHARAIKRRACSARLAELLERAGAIATADVRRASEVAEEIANGAEAVRDFVDKFDEEIGRHERHALHKRVGELYRAAAIEMLDLIQPRKLPFGSHSATRADRDYLLSLLETGYNNALDGAMAATAVQLELVKQAAIDCVERAGTVIGGDPAAEIRAIAEDAIELIEARAIDRCKAYVSGYLHGGYVERFFRVDLPKIDLSEDAIFHALNRDSADLDRQFVGPLAVAVQSGLIQLAAGLRRMAATASLRAFDHEAGLVAALARLDGARRELIEELPS